MKASIFAVQFNTQCFTSVIAEHTFEKYGQPPFGLGCANGRGGIVLNDVYRIDYHPKYSWKKTVGFCIDCIGRSDGVGIADVFAPNAVACLGVCEDTWNATACQYHSDRWCTVFTSAELSHGEVHNGVARGDGTEVAACWAVDHCKKHKPLVAHTPTSQPLRTIKHVDPVDNSQCLKSVQRKGCYDTRSLFKRGKNLVFWRYKIDWKNLAQFASNLACECTKKAKAAGVEYFGLHFYGECWALTQSDIIMSSNGDCTLASDMTKKCTDKWNFKYSSECLGKKSYFVYKILKDGEAAEPVIMA